MKWIEGWYSSYALLGAAAAGLIPILLPLLVTRTGSATQLGLGMGAFSLGGLTAPAWGALADSRRAHRPLLAGGLLALAVGTALFALASSFPAWIALALLQGVGLAAASTVANLFVVETKPRAEWDKRIGWLQAFYGGGQVAGLLLAGALGQRAPKAGILLAAGLTAAAVIPALAAAPRLPEASLAVTAFSGVVGAVAGGWTASLRGYAAVPVVGLAGVAAGLIMMIFLTGGTEEVAR